VRHQYNGRFGFRTIGKKEGTVIYNRRKNRKDGWLCWGHHRTQTVCMLFEKKVVTAS